MSRLVALEALNFGGFKFLKKIPKGLKGFEMFEEASYVVLRNLGEIPSEASTVLVLEKISCNECISLTKIPEELGGLTCSKKSTFGNSRPWKNFYPEYAHLWCPKNGHLMDANP